jgi:hypothetical protein
VVREGGCLTYATCTIRDQENQDVAAAFEALIEGRWGRDDSLVMRSRPAYKASVSVIAVMMVVLMIGDPGITLVHAGDDDDDDDDDDNDHDAGASSPGRWLRPGDQRWRRRWEGGQWAITPLSSSPTP